jgi:FtsH-binding integral membrane protein
MSESGHLSIWFFVGVLLTTYGVLITAAGVYGLSHPPDVKLANLHADLWWGVILFLLGLTYVIIFNPRRSMSKAQAQEPEV